MEEQQFIEIEENFAEQISQGVSSFPKISKKEIKYHANIAKLVSLLNAGTTQIDASGVVKVHYIIVDEDYRLELQTYIMDLVRKNLGIK